MGLAAGGSCLPINTHVCRDMFCSGMLQEKLQVHLENGLSLGSLLGYLSGPSSLHT